ncbi:MAG: amidohydrolase family protein [Myxococcales bacterium]|nr:amidohydrolase family protein [Myxococcales bacterium]
MKTLIEGGTIVTCDPHDRVVVGDVLVDGPSVVGIGRNLRPKGPVRVLDARGCAVIPGFVQAHIHLCQVLMRGMADDLPLLEWLRERIWPLEGAHDEASLRASADLGLLEMVRAGTTTVLDMGTVNHHDVVMDAAVRSGLRVVSGKAMMDAGDGVPRALRETTRRSLAESERLRKAWHGAASGRVLYAYAPRFILSCSEELFRAVAAASTEHEVLMHSHAAEHPDERDAVRRLLGDDDVAVLRRWGFTGKRAVLAHGVQLTDAEIRDAARSGTRFVHCPSANLKLGSGIARTHEMLERGVVMGLGADGAPCNNNLDPWTELRHAALLSKIRAGTESLVARRALRLATIDGATALGLGDVTGSIENGKRADLAVVRLDGAHVEPGGDVYSKLVYACTARDVVHVLVDGVRLVRFGEATSVDADAVLREARAQAKKLARRAGLSA